MMSFSKQKLTSSVLGRKGWISIWLTVGFVAPREQVLEVGDGPVGDADGLGLAFLVQLLHGAPGGLLVLGQFLVDHVGAFLVERRHVVLVLL
jgi:hypothetical protein